MKTTHTAFYVLGANLHSTRAEIHRLAEFASEGRLASILPPEPKKK